MNRAHRERTDPRFPGSRQRDTELEQAITRQLCGGLFIDVAALNAFAGRRADRGETSYGFDFPDLRRNLPLEAAQEGGDGVNYTRWFLQACNLGWYPDSEHWKMGHMQNGLRYFALAFNEVRQAV